MRVSTAFMDLPAPDVNLGHPQAVHEGQISDHAGASELPPNPELMAGTAPSESLGNPAPLEEKTVWAAAKTTEIIQQNDSASLASNRTRSGRRVNQPAVQDHGSRATKELAAPIKAAPKKRKRQTRQVNIVCTGCYRGNSPSNNFIVLCDACDAPWHQKCHRPNIENEVIEIPEMKWYCINCNPEQRRVVQTKPQKNLAVKEQKGTTPKKQPVFEHEVGGSYYSEEERRAYLLSLSHESLVRLVMKVSNKWPSVPMFPSDMEPVTDFTPSLLAMAQNNQASNPKPNTITNPAFIDEAIVPANPLAMDSTTVAADADKSFTELVSEAAPIPSLSDALEGITADHGVGANTHGQPTPAGSGPSTTTNLQHPTKTIFELTPQTTNTAKPTRKASLVSWNSDLLTDDESSYSPSHPQSLSPFVSRASQVGSHHGSESDPEDYRVYPEPGKGFKLPSTPSDLEILAEDKSCATFSHSIRVPGNKSQG